MVYLLLFCSRNIIMPKLARFYMFIKYQELLEKPRDFDPFGQTGFAHLWLQYD